MTSPETNDQTNTRVRRVMFLYWGRRGAMPLFTLQLGRAACRIPNLEATICVSRQNAMFSDYSTLGNALLPVDTFTTHAGAFAQSWRLPGIRRTIAAYIARNKVDAVVDLMPHVWSPFIASAIQARGARYIAVVHDADAHPGDRTTWVKAFTDRDLHKADAILTLSQAVAQRLEGAKQISSDRIFSLFMPDLELSSSAPTLRMRAPDAPIRLMFLGRVMPYKGLGLFVETIEALRAKGLPVEAGIYGEGSLAPYADRLDSLGATIVNRWLTESEIAAIVPQYDAVLLSHVEASQSGIVAVAFGAGLPVIATPVGGLAEQIADGVTGAIATSVDAPALASAVERVFASPAVYENLCANVAARRSGRSMQRFVELCAAIAAP